MKKFNSNIKSLIQKGKQLHHHYKEKGFYSFVGGNVLKIIFFYALFIGLIFLIGKYLLDLKSLFQFSIDSFPDELVLALFFVSESFLGLIPVDLFVIWTTKFASPFLYLSILGVLSYIGGIISYYIGRWISGRPKIKRYTEKKLSKYITFVRKWGGAFIVIAALFPLSPFSMVVIAVSLLKYPFKLFLLFGLIRLIRFVIQGAIFFNLLRLDTWF